MNPNGIWSRSETQTIRHLALTQLDAGLKRGHNVDRATLRQLAVRQAHPPTLAPVARIRMHFLFAYPRLIMDSNLAGKPSSEVSLAVFLTASIILLQG